MKTFLLFILITCLSANCVASVPYIGLAKKQPVYIGLAEPAIELQDAETLKQQFQPFGLAQQDCPGGVCPPPVQQSVTVTSTSPVVVQSPRSNWSQWGSGTVVSYGSTGTSYGSFGGRTVSYGCNGNRVMSYGSFGSRAVSYSCPSCPPLRNYSPSRSGSSQMFAIGTTDQEHLIRHHGYSPEQVYNASPSQLIAMHEAAHGHGFGMQTGFAFRQRGYVRGQPVRNLGRFVFRRRF